MEVRAGRLVADDNATICLRDRKRVARLIVEHGRRTEEQRERHARQMRRQLEMLMDRRHQQRLDDRQDEQRQNGRQQNDNWQFQQCRRRRNRGGGGDKQDEKGSEECDGDGGPAVEDPSRTLSSPRTLSPPQPCNAGSGSSSGGSRSSRRRNKHRQQQQQQQQQQQNRPVA